MKKKIYVLLSFALIMMLSLTGCGASGNPKETSSENEAQKDLDSSSEEEENPQPNAASYEVGESCTLKTFDNIDYTLDPNDDAYLPENVEPLGQTPLTGKTFYWLGSSVFDGSLADRHAVADYIAVRNGANCVKEAVGGTTMFGEEGSAYWSRLTTTEKFDKNAQIDAFFCQISTNDSNSDNKRGEVTAPDVTDLEQFDTGTTAGAMEYIVCYVNQTWHCPVYFISGSYYGQEKTFDGEYRDNGSGEKYAELVELAQAVTEKWNNIEGVTCGVIDLYNDDAFNYISADDYSYFMNSTKRKKEYVLDPVHPRMAGYLYWWTPYIESSIIEKLGLNE